MKIALIVEGKTEKAFVPILRDFLSRRLSGRMPDLNTRVFDGRIPTGDTLRRFVCKLLSDPGAFEHVIALTDVYTGKKPPDFVDASDAKAKMRDWVGDDPRFHPHAAQYDFEAWLLPYWSTIQRLAGHNRRGPTGNPEAVDHDNPPAHRIKAMFITGRRRERYVKPRDAARILRDNDLSVAIDQCRELKAFVNTILSICGGEGIK